MSLNLLAGYGSDEESTEEKEQDKYGEDVEEKVDDKEEKASTSEEVKEENEEGKQKSFFSSDFVSSSDDDEEEEEDNSEATQSSNRLPSARSVLMGTANLESSLFISEAEKEQDANNALLSQHVPVSERVNAEQRAFRGKRKGQPCRQFMAGKCTRGTRCRYAHVLPHDSSG
ncbi:hypothetical protein PFISCL1PPCAC_1589, partial [Pristionchus fissidentatus]